MEGKASSWTLSDRSHFAVTVDNIEDVAAMSEGAAYDFDAPCDKQCTSSQLTSNQA